jgi:hypothetical protein
VRDHVEPWATPQQQHLVLHPHSTAPGLAAAATTQRQRTFNEAEAGPASSLCYMLARIWGTANQPRRPEASVLRDNSSRRTQTAVPSALLSQIIKLYHHSSDRGQASLRSSLHQRHPGKPSCRAVWSTRDESRSRGTLAVATFISGRQTGWTASLCDDPRNTCQSRHYLPVEHDFEKCGTLLNIPQKNVECTCEPLLQMQKVVSKDASSPTCRYFFRVGDDEHQLTCC